MQLLKCGIFHKILKTAKKNTKSWILEYSIKSWIQLISRKFGMLVIPVIVDNNDKTTLIWKRNQDNLSYFVEILKFNFRIQIDFQEFLAYERCATPLFFIHSCATIFSFHNYKN